MIDKRMKSLGFRMSEGQGEQEESRLRQDRLRRRTGGGLLHMQDDPPVKFEKARERSANVIYSAL